MGTITTEELIETIKHKKSGDILYILEELYNSENKNKETSEEKVEYELTEDELETLKNGLIFVIKNDSEIKDKIIDILRNEASNRTRMADIGSNATTIIVALIWATTYLGAKIIKAIKPNKENIKIDANSIEINIERGYTELDIKNKIKTIKDLLKDTTDE